MKIYALPLAFALLTSLAIDTATALPPPVPTSGPWSAGVAKLTEAPEFTPAVESIGHNLFLVLGVARVGDRGVMDTDRVAQIIEALAKLNELANVHCGPDDPCRDYLTHVLGDRVKWAYALTEGLDADTRARIDARLRQVVGYVDGPDFIDQQVRRLNLASYQGTRSANATNLSAIGLAMVVIDASVLTVAALTGYLNWPVGGLVGLASVGAATEMFRIVRQPYAPDRTVADTPNYVGPALADCVDSLLE